MRKPRETSDRGFGVFEPQRANGRSKRGFTVPEILAVIAVIALLIAVLLPALSGAKSTAQMTKSMNNLRQIGTWMGIYSNDNRDHVLPSQFDYRGNSYTGKVRSVISTGFGVAHTGTWTDILWTQEGLGNFKWAVPEPKIGHDYETDSIDDLFYTLTPQDFENPLRSAASNSRDTPQGLYGGGAPIMLPFGTGAMQSGFPGFFAANDFFNSRPDAPAIQPTGGGLPIPTPSGGRWYTNGQIRDPARSMYLVDSFVGEVISHRGSPNPALGYAPSAVDAAFNTDHALSPRPLEVDFRYNGACLMLMLDGSSSQQTAWEDLNDLENSRRVRVRDLDLAKQAP